MNLKNKNTIGFVGAPWTLLVYMINQQSPKKNVKKNFFEDEYLINRILLIIEKFLKIHIKPHPTNKTIITFEDGEQTMYDGG